MDFSLLKKQIFIFILASGFLEASVLSNTPVGLKRNATPLKEACQKGGYKHTLLTEVINQAKIDCMGKEVLATDLCEKIYPREDLLRGIIVKEKVVCEFAKASKIAFSCDNDKKKADFCIDEKKGCAKLGKIFAKKLKLTHFAIEKRGEQRLNCYFSLKDDEVDKILDDTIL